MLDQMNHNPLAVTGTPSLVTGSLTVDPDQALSFNGTTNSAAATDSTSLSITGSLSIELFVKLAALPGATRDIVRKTGSYAVQVDSTGHVLFVLTGPSSSVTVTSNVTLSTGTWYHLACVYNGNYAGAAQFGKTTTGSVVGLIADDNGANKEVTSFALAESALLTSAKLSLEYTDEIWQVNMCAVVYADNAGAPGALVTKSDVRLMYPPTPALRAWTWVNFPLIPAVVPAGNYHIGYVADTIGPPGKSALAIGKAATGGTTSSRNDSVTGPSDPFGSVTTSTANVMSAYCDYTAVSRTGFEGKALIYINGARNTTSVYTGGIADTANAVDVCPALAAQVDEISIWNKPLTSVQIANHYTAH